MLCKILDYNTLLENCTLVIDFLLKDKCYLVKVSISSVLFEIYKFQIISLNNLSLKSLKENNYVVNNLKYVRDLEHSSVIKRFLGDKDYRVRVNAYYLAFNFGYEFGVDVFLKYFFDLFIDIFEDTCYEIRETGVKLIEKLLIKFNTSNSWVYNNLIPKLSKLVDSKKKYQYRISGIKALIISGKFLQDQYLTDLVVKPVLSLFSSKSEVSNVKLIILKEIVKNEFILNESSIRDLVKK